MKISHPFTLFTRCCTLALVAGACGLAPSNLRAQSPKQSNPQPIITEQMFDSPGEAINAMRSAVEAKDKSALRKIFGSEFDSMLTGDTVQDSNNADRLAAAMAKGCNQAWEGTNTIYVEIGTNNWPLPIPLVKADDNKWHFDTAAGKEEIINRHVGKDELHAIGVCAAYVAAQKQYMTDNIGGLKNYAEKFKSSHGKKDGLYWKTADGETASPFGPLVAEAHAEGYHPVKGKKLQPFHGYYFRILTAQGKDAPGGKMDYLLDGKLTAGFALVAWPEHWDQSGIMTFIVNQDGKVYQRNLGEDTSRMVGGIKEYNPDSEWTLVKDTGVTSIVWEK